MEQRTSTPTCLLMGDRQKYKVPFKNMQQVAG